MSSLPWILNGRTRFTLLLLGPGRKEIAGQIGIPPGTGTGCIAEWLSIS